MIISSIVDKATGKEVLDNYKNRELDITKCNYTKGKNLVITYKTGSYFKHETVDKAVYKSKTTIEIETVNKRWIISE